MAERWWFIKAYPCLVFSLPYISNFNFPVGSGGARDKQFVKDGELKPFPVWKSLSK